MARALQCPKCSTKHPLDQHAGEATFLCGQCGQLLKVPEQLRSAPRRTPADDRTIVSQGGSTRVLPAQPAPAPGPTPARPRVEPAPARPAAIWRVLAWIVAVFGGGLLVFAGGRAVGYLSGQRALDVVLSSGVERYTVLLPLVPIWALVTTALVTLFLDGGAALARRRRARRADAAAHDAPPKPPRPSEGRRSGRPGAHVTEAPGS